jgi:hypothetical protein
MLESVCIIHVSKTGRKRRRRMRKHLMDVQAQFLESLSEVLAAEQCTWSWWDTQTCNAGDNLSPCTEYIHLINLDIENDVMSILYGQLECSGRELICIPIMVELLSTISEKICSRLVGNPSKRTKAVPYCRYVEILHWFADTWSTRLGSMKRVLRVDDLCQTHWFQLLTLW